jgi:hypothetical protein
MKLASTFQGRRRLAQSLRAVASLFFSLLTLPVLSQPQDLAGGGIPGEALHLLVALAALLAGYAVGCVALIAAVLKWWGPYRTRGPR